MTWQGINVEVPHSLSQEAAFDRLLEYFQGRKQRPTWGAVSVELLAAHIEPREYRLTSKIKVTVLAREFTHTLTFQVQPSKVQVTSDKPDELFEGPEMQLEARELQSMLSEALK